MGLAYKEPPRTDAARVLTMAEEPCTTTKAGKGRGPQEQHRGDHPDAAPKQRPRIGAFKIRLASWPRPGRWLKLPERTSKAPGTPATCRHRKIVLEPKLLNINHHLSENEWSEIAGTPSSLPDPDAYRRDREFDEPCCAKEAVGRQRISRGTGH
jgi:hypothetical protein